MAHWPTAFLQQFIWTTQGNGIWETPTRAWHCSELLVYLWPRGSKPTLLRCALWYWGRPVSISLLQAGLDSKGCWGRPQKEGASFPVSEALGFPVVMRSCQPGALWPAVGRAPSGSTVLWLSLPVSVAPWQTSPLYLGGNHTCGRKSLLRLSWQLLLCSFCVLPSSWVAGPHYQLMTTSITLPSSNCLLTGPWITQGEQARKCLWSA